MGFSSPSPTPAHQFLQGRLPPSLQHHFSVNLSEIPIFLSETRGFTQNAGFEG